MKTLFEIPEDDFKEIVAMKEQIERMQQALDERLNSLAYIYYGFSIGDVLVRKDGSGFNSPITLEQVVCFRACEGVLMTAGTDYGFVALRDYVLAPKDDIDSNTVVLHVK